MPACYAPPMPPYPGYLMRVGVRGENVRQVQTCLNRINNAGLVTDGIFGPLTQAAVIQFQRDSHLNPDGIVGPLTWDALMQRCGFSGRMTARGMEPVTEPVAEPVCDAVADDVVDVTKGFDLDFEKMDLTDMDLEVLLKIFLVRKLNKK